MEGGREEGREGGREGPSENGMDTYHFVVRNLEHKLGIYVAVLDQIPCLHSREGGGVIRE